MESANPKSQFLAVHMRQLEGFEVIHGCQLVSASIIAF